MMNSNDLKSGKVLAFDLYCKKIMRNEARDFYREQDKLRTQETLFSELTEQEKTQLYACDTYFNTEHFFKVLNFDISVKGEWVYQALSLLSEPYRNILLLSYFVGMTDKQIGEKLSLLRATVQYRRISALKKLRACFEIVQRGFTAP